MHTHTLTTTSPLVHMNMHMKMCANTHPWKRQLQWQPHTQSCLTNRQKDKHIPRLSTIITHIPRLQGKHIPRLSTINTHKQFIYLLLLTFINMQLPSLKTTTSLQHAFQPMSSSRDTMRPHASCLMWRQKKTLQPYSMFTAHAAAAAGWPKTSFLEEHTYTQAH